MVAGFAGDTRLAGLSDAEVAQVFDARLVAQGGLMGVPGVRIWFEDENGKFVAGMKPGDVMSDEVWHEIHEVRVKGGWHVWITSDALPADIAETPPLVLLSQLRHSPLKPPRSRIAAQTASVTSISRPLRDMFRFVVGCKLRGVL